jgi:hypothetical protein
MFSKSTDGGNTWSAPAVAASATLAPDPNFCCFYGALPKTTNERVSNIPSNAAIGSGSSAKVYTTFYNWTGTKMQLEAAVSNNGGTTWGAPVIVSNVPTGDQFFPWVNLARNGTVGLTWLDRRGDSADVKYQPFFTISTNGGVSYAAAHALTSTQSNPNNDGFGGGFMGDYRTHVWIGGSIYAVWPDTRTGVSQDEIGGVKLR